jgi:sulfite reductase alpha subunit-like flavoprotein
MHGRFDHPFAWAFAGFGTFYSFLVSLSHSLASHAPNAQYTLFATVDDATVRSWAGTGVAVMAMASPGIIKLASALFKAFFDIKQTAGSAEMDTLSDKLGDQVTRRKEAEFDLGVTQKDLKAALKKIKDLEAKLEATEKKLEGSEAHSAKQDEEIRDNRHKLRNFEQDLAWQKIATQKTEKVAKNAENLAADQTAKVDEHDQRIKTLEHVTGSSDEIPTG